MISSYLIGLNITILLLGVFLALYGYQSLVDLIEYVELNLKYFWVRIQLYFLGRKLRRELKQMGKQFNKDKI
jgi:hypothetical protein